MSDEPSPRESDEGNNASPPVDGQAVRLAKLEGRLNAVEARLEELLAVEQSRKQRAVIYRLVLLALLLLGFFFLRMKQGAGP